MPARLWEELTTEEMAGLHARDRHVVLLPIAAIESHGPHLPLSVDATINRGILAEAARRLPDDVPLLILPEQVVGRSEEHDGFAGTLWAPPETLIAHWTAIGVAVARAGFRKLVFFNSHGGQPQIADIVAMTLRRVHRMLAANVHWADTVDLSDLFGPAERRFGIHGGAIETAMMLHLRPDLVRRERLADFPSITARLSGTHRWLSPQGPAGYAWMTEDLNPAGACGDATAATAEAGRVVVERAGAALARIITELAAADPEALFGRPAYPPPAAPLSGR